MSATAAALAFAIAGAVMVVVVVEEAASTLLVFWGSSDTNSFKWSLTPVLSQLLLLLLHTTNITITAAAAAAAITIVACKESAWGGHRNREMNSREVQKERRNSREREGNKEKEGQNKREYERSGGQKQRGNSWRELIEKKGVQKYKRWIQWGKREKRDTKIQRMNTRERNAEK